MEEKASDSGGLRMATAVLAAADGDGAAASELLPLVYAELRALAARRLADLPPGQTIQPTAVVHEAYLRVCRHGDPGFNGRAHFFRTAARAMRDVLVEHARSKLSLKRGGAGRRVEMADELARFESPAEEVVAVAEELEALGRHSGRAAEVVVMRFFGGYSPALVAELLEVSERTVEREWRYARAWLHERLAGEK